MNSLANVLSQLREFGGARLGELDSQLEEHRTWLGQAVEDAKLRVAPAAKKQRLASGRGKATTSAEQQARRAAMPGCCGRAARTAAEPPPHRSVASVGGRGGAASAPRRAQGQGTSCCAGACA